MEFQELLKTKLQFPASRHFGDMSYPHFFHFYPAEERLSDTLIYPYADSELFLESPTLFSFDGLPGYLFLYLYNSYLTLEGEDGAVTCRPGQALLLPASEHFTITLPAPGTHLYLCFLDGGCSGLLAKRLCSPSIHPLEVPASSCAAGNIRYLIRHPVTDSDAAQILFSSKFTELLTELYAARECPMPKSRQTPPYIEAVRELFDEQYAQAHSLDQLETLYDKSKYTICREFSRHFGVSPLQYLNQRRIEEAKKLLLSTDMPIHEIGAQVGIENTNHFIQLFKKYTGATPFVFKQAAPAIICELRYPDTPDVRSR